MLARNMDKYSESGPIIIMGTTFIGGLLGYEACGVPGAILVGGSTGIAALASHMMLTEPLITVTFTSK